MIMIIMMMIMIMMITDLTSIYFYEVLKLITSLGKNILIQLGLLMYTSLLTMMLRGELEVLMILIRTTI